MKLNILAFGAHPDDVELGAGGTLAKHVDKGYKVGIIDLTPSDLSTRGTVESRMAEAEVARVALGVHVRQNLGMPDGFFALNDDNLLEIIRTIRHYQPEIVIANAPEDRHPDHGRGASLVRQANFLAGLAKIETSLGNKGQAPWRGHKLFHYIQFKHLEPDILVDIRGYADKKRAALDAYKSQFYNPDSTEPETMISSLGFMKMTEGRDAHYGGMAAIFEAEGFVSQLKPAVDDLFHLLGKL